MQNRINLDVERRVSRVEADLRWIKWLLVASVSSSVLNLLGIRVLDSVTLWHP